MEKKKSEFDKVLGAWDILVIAFGAMIGWGWVVSTGSWIEKGGVIGAALGFIIGGIMIFFVGMTYAELTAAMPQCGGEHVFSYRAMGAVGSFICTWMIVLGYVSVACFEACAFPTIITYLWPGFLKGYLYTVAGFDIYASWLIVAIVLAFIIMVINILGAKTAAILQTILTCIIGGAGILLIVASIINGSVDNMSGQMFASSNSGVNIKAIIGVASLSPFYFIGFDVIPQAAEEINVPAKKIGKILRKSARQYATDGYFAKTEIKPTDLYDFLGAPEYTRDKYQGNDYAGVVTGLAWTAVGGEILFVETSLSRGKGGRLTLTGNLGDVMKESAMLALEYIKAHASVLSLDEEIFDNWNIHIHVPEGAIPKDGPSAGITMATSLASALTQRKVKANIAMTGEITLRGKVLPVGGIKEKILAAKRAGIKEIIMSAENKKNIDEIQYIYLKGLTFHYVNDIKEVFAIALTNEKVADPIDLSVKKPSQE